MYCHRAWGTVTHISHFWGDTLDVFGPIFNTQKAFEA